VPALGLACRVLESKGKNGFALLNGILLVGFAAERIVDGVEGSRRGELVWVALASHRKSLANAAYRS